MTLDGIPELADRSATAQLFIDALLKPAEETRAALVDWLTDDVTLSGQFGTASGKDEVMPYLESAPELSPGQGLAEYLAPAEWSAPVLAVEYTTPGDAYTKSPGFDGDDAVILEANKPPRHFVFAFSFGDGGRIAKIEIGAWIEASEKLPVRIPDDVKELIATASDHWRQLVVSYATGDGKMHTGLRGSAYVYSDDQIALWAREDGGSLARALADNADQEISLLYFDPDRGAYYEFYGRARIDPSEAVRNEVYETMHEWERNHSWERKGQAVIIDIDRVRGATMDGFVEMERQQ